MIKNKAGNKSFRKTGSTCQRVLMQAEPQFDPFHRYWSCICLNVCNSSADVLAERAQQEPVDTVNIGPVK